MRTAFISGNSISKATSRKHAGLGKILDWEEKRCRPDPSHKAQSTIYACAGIFFVSMVVFVFCTTIDSSAVPGQSSLSSSVPVVARGWSVQKGAELSARTVETSSRRRRAALQGMGTVFRRGTKAMNELVVAHVSESTSVEDFRMFLRTLHRSGVTARADVALLFPWSPPPGELIDVIHEEEYNFQKLLLGRLKLASAEPLQANNSALIEAGLFVRLSSNSTISPFNFNAFKKAAIESDSSVQPLWGWRNGNLSESDSLRAMWGSIVGFEASELNPDDALQGFIDQPPLQLRRWACYQMLLGMVRHKFKHIFLTEVSGVLVLRDPLAMARRKGGLYLSLEDRTWGAATGSDELGVREAGDEVTAQNSTQVTEDDGTEHAGTEHEELELKSDRNNNNSGETMMRRQLTAESEMRRKGSKRRKARRSTVAGLCEKVYGKQIWSRLEEVEKKKRVVNSGAVVGGIHQIRGLANAMVTEIVKVALERKNRNPFPDNVLLSYLLHKSSVLGKRVLEHLHLMENEDSFVHSSVGSEQHGLFFKKGRQAYAVVHGYNKGARRWSGVVSALHRDICSSPADAAVYSDCQHQHS